MKIREKNDIIEFVRKQFCLLEEDYLMSVVLVTLFIIVVSCWAFCRLFWAISKPLFIFLYHNVINAFMERGMSEEAAKAAVSGIAILIIIVLIIQ